MLGENQKKLPEEKQTKEKKNNFWMFQILKRLDLSNVKHSYSLFSTNAGEFSNYMH